ncbi:AP2-associated protein kinase 1 isoform X1 [Ixodes scapularis]
MNGCVSALSCGTLKKLRYMLLLLGKGAFGRGGGEFCAPRVSEAVARWKRSRLTDRWRQWSLERPNRNMTLLFGGSQEDQHPPHEFGVSPKGLSPSWGLSPLSRSQRELVEQKRGLLDGMLRSAKQVVDCYVTEKESQPYVGAPEPCLTEQSACGRLATECLVPTLRELLSDGLLPHVRGVFGRLPNSLWHLAHSLSQTKEGRKEMQELVEYIGQTDNFCADGEKFSACLLGLLNLGCLDTWFLTLLSSPQILQKHYQTSAAFVALLSHPSLFFLREELACSLRSLSELPFSFSLSFALAAEAQSLKRHPAAPFPARSPCACPPATNYGESPGEDSDDLRTATCQSLVDSSSLEETLDNSSRVLELQRKLKGGASPMDGAKVLYPAMQKIQGTEEEVQRFQQLRNHWEQMSHVASGEAASVADSPKPTKITSPTKLPSPTKTPSGFGRRRFAVGLVVPPDVGGGAPGLAESLGPTPPSSPTPSQRSHHRRNVSDTSAFVKPFVQETSQFLAPFEVSQGRVPSPASSDNPSQHWNPFADDRMVEDHLFGQEFDKIRRGSQSSISNVKSRESLVMSSGDLVDPFGAAPFSRSGKSGRARSSSARGAVHAPHGLALPHSGGTAALEEDHGDLLAPRARHCSEHSSTSQESREAAVPPTVFGTSPFARAPPEDRSKYEKLLDDVEEDATARATGHKQTRLLSAEEDKDSIGSASDLQARVELSEEEEVDLAGRPERPEAKERPRRAPCEGAPHEAARGFPDAFVGHAEGERPLLEDDQLSDAEPKPAADDLAVLVAKTLPPPPKREPATEGPAPADIFTEAPFRKPRPGRRSSDSNRPTAAALPAEIRQGRAPPHDFPADYRRLATHANSEGELSRGLPSAAADLFGAAPFAQPPGAVDNGATAELGAALRHNSVGVVLPPPQPEVPTRALSHQDLFGAVPFALDNGSVLGEADGSPDSPAGSEEGEEGALHRFRKERNRRYQQLRTEEDVAMTEDLVEARGRVAAGRRRKNADKATNAFSNLSFEDIGSEEDAGPAFLPDFRASAVGK